MWIGIKLGKWITFQTDKALHIGCNNEIHLGVCIYTQCKCCIFRSFLKCLGKFVGDFGRTFIGSLTAHGEAFFFVRCFKGELFQNGKGFSFHGTYGKFSSHEIFLYENFGIPSECIFNCFFICGYVACDWYSYADSAVVGLDDNREFKSVLCGIGDGWTLLDGVSVGYWNTHGAHKLFSCSFVGGDCGWEIITSGIVETQQIECGLNLSVFTLSTVKRYEDEIRLSAYLKHIGTEICIGLIFSALSGSPQIRNLIGNIPGI